MKALLILLIMHPYFCLSEDGYGLFQVNKVEVIHCEKGMKPQTTTEAKIVAGINEKGHWSFWAYLNFKADIGPLMGKIRVYRTKDDKMSQLITINQANLCQFSFPLKLLPFTIKTDKNCIVKAAEYPNATLDVEEMVHGLLGKKFFFGSFKFYLEWFSKKQTAVCIYVFSDIVSQGKKKN